MHFLSTCLLHVLLVCLYCILYLQQGAMHQAHMRTKVAGSATCCVLQLDQEKKLLVAANLVREQSQLLNMDLHVQKYNEWNYLRPIYNNTFNC